MKPNQAGIITSLGDPSGPFVVRVESERAVDTGLKDSGPQPGRWLHH